MTLLTTQEQARQEARPTECPICGADHERFRDSDDDYVDGPAGDPGNDIHAAAHCCLWKTHNHAARVRIAERVELGSNWSDAINGESHG